MKKEIHIAIIYGLAQLFFSIIVWGNFEYSILLGDMAQSNGTNYWTFVLGNRLNYYVAYAAINSIFFWILSFKGKQNFHPGAIGSILLAAGATALTVLLFLNTIFKAPYTLAPIIAFLTSSLIYYALFEISKKS